MTTSAVYGCTSNAPTSHFVQPPPPGSPRCDRCSLSVGIQSRPNWLRYEDARYRVLDTDPLTIEWEHTSCVELESKSGTVEEICGRESQTGPVDRVACR